MSPNHLALKMAHQKSARAPDDDAPWWKGATLYQVYPISFRDTTGDGRGDLRGIIDALDYIASLNVDGVWISPFFRSPMRDYGYDVADYCDVDPRFGTLGDFDDLVARAHGLGLKIVIDQVYSHTSSDHPWFVESARDKASPKADWYVWADAKPDGSPPSNWQSVFGGPAWQWCGKRKQYYLHNFLTSQPDLNVRNPEVQNALLDVARFWLDRGVDGFRLDAINFAMHDAALPDNPPSNAPMETVTRPFDMQRHLYNQSHPDIVPFLERVRAVMDAYGGRFSVAEVGGPNPLAEMKAFTDGDNRLNSAYSFDFLYAPTLGADRVSAVMAQWSQSDEEGWPSWAFSNHDAPRAVTRWTRERETPQATKLYMLLLLALRGNPFVYQGEELGLPQGAVAFDDLKDPEAIENWPHTLGRDGARTPFPWQAAARHAGFTTGAPWLPLDPRHAPMAVDAQDGEPQSHLSFTRDVIGLRRSSRLLREGTMVPLETPDGVLAFQRRLGDTHMVCAFNLCETAQNWRPPGQDALRVAATNLASIAKGAPPPTTLEPGAGYWAMPQEA